MHVSTQQAIESAVAYVRRIADAYADDAVDGRPARFVIHYQGNPGAGTGGTAGITRAAALRYLTDLTTDHNRAVLRYGLKSIEVRADIPTVTFVA